MEKTPNIKNFQLLLMLMLSQQLHSQTDINFKEYFFQQNQTEYTLHFKAEKDSTTRLTKIIKVLGKDTIEISNYGYDHTFINSKTYAIDSSVIKVIKAKSSIKQKIFDTEIGSNIWVQKKMANPGKIQLDLRTEDTCASFSHCYWEWERLRQTGLKKGIIRYEGKKYQAIIITFDILRLYQPKHLSSISGLTSDVQSYVFAKGLGLIKIITTFRKLNLSSTLVLQK